MGVVLEKVVGDRCLSLSWWRGGVGERIGFCGC